MTLEKFTRIEDYVIRCDEDKTRFSNESLSEILGSARPYILKYLGRYSVTISDQGKV